MNWARIIKWTLIVVLLLTTVTLSLVAFLWHSEAGARWALARLETAANGRLTTTEVTGSLASGLQFRSLKFESDGLRAGASGVRLTATVHWPFSLTIDALRADSLAMEWTPAQEGDSGQPSAVGALRPPLPVEIRKARIEQVTVTAAGQKEGFGPVRLGLSARWDDQLDLDVLEIEGPDYGLQLHGEITLAPSFPHDFSFQLQLPERIVSALGADQADFDGRIEGDLRHSHFQLKQPNRQLVLSGELDFAQDQPEWSATLDALGLSFPLSSAGEDRLEITRAQVKARGSGSRYAIEATGQAAQARIGPVDWTLSGTGDASHLQVPDLQLDASWFEAALQVGFEWDGEPSVDIDGAIGRLSPASWLDAWPEEKSLRGTFALHWDDTGTDLSRLALQIEDSAARLEGHGRWRSEAGSADLELQWADWHWPIDGTPRISSPEGKLALAGTPTDWRLQSTFGLRAAGFPDATLEVSASGGPQDATVQLDDSAILGGHVSGSASVAWDDSLSWSADLVSRRLHLGAVWPEWPAIVDARLHLGDSGGAGWPDLEIQTLSGTLRGDPFRASGNVHPTSDGPVFEQFQLEAPHSMLEIDGGLVNGLDFAIDTARPGLLAGIIGADISGQGRVSGSAGRPALDLDLTVGAWASQGLAFDQLVLKGSAGPGRPDAAMQARAEGITINGARADHVRLDLANTGTQQVIEIQAEQESSVLHLRTIGRLSGWLQTGALAWQGELTDFSMNLDGSPALSLQQPVSLDASPTSLHVDSGCLLLMEDGRICLGANWRAPGDFQLDGRLADVAVQALADHFVSGLKLTQRVSGAVHWQQVSGRAPSGRAELSLTPGRIGRSGYPDLDFDTGTGAFGFELDGGQLNRGKLRLPFEDLGDVDIDFSIRDLAMDGTGRLDGQALIDIRDLALLELFVPPLTHVSGRLVINTRLGGRTADPTLDGTLALEDMRMDIPALGLKAVGLHLSGNVSRQDQMSLQGSLSSGDGEAAVSALLDVSQWNDPDFELQVDGSALKVIDVPDLTILANPDLRIGWRPGEWSVDGRLDIPRARLSPTTAVADRVNESSDVEIVAGQPAVEARAPDANTWLVNGRVTLGLGDDVRIDMPSVRIKATGELELAWPGRLLPDASGQLTLQGEIRAFGPRLEVVQGHVRFQGRPVDDPALDVRAERDILGNSQIQTAGIRIAGTARRPQIEAYTYPITTEDRAWALLVTGSDFQYGQGIGGFDIGTYVAPRLYISYGVSLAGEDRTVSARYDLRKGFGIKATSSQEDNGVDMSYTVER